MWKGFILFVIGHIVIHTIVFISIFDLYYQSTVVKNVQPLQWSSDGAAAKRLVLFVADGLRADKFYELDEKNVTRAPFLRDVIANNGTWGVSHTRAPTESRPAHIAMLGGFFEDPNALLAKFQDNLIEFDTVLNESRETWAWGGSDVLPFFNKGSAKSHVHIDCHDYNEGGLSKLDVWVFNRVKYLFKRAESDKKLRESIMRDKIIFFLHLAGIDSNGHRHHPSSRYYLENIGVVDQGVKEIAELFKKFYGNDGKTAFIFTADHGMTDPDGGHGGGDPTEIRTPIVAWGHGVAHKIGRTTGNIILQNKIEDTRHWGLDASKREDISQLDISVLMAALIDVPFPVNSIGNLPLAYLEGGIRVNALQAFARTRQIIETYLTKKKFVQKNVFHIWFWEYQTHEEYIVREMENVIVNLIRNGKHGPALGKCKVLFQYTSKLLYYYQYYHRTNIYTCIILSLLGWMVLASVRTFRETNVSRNGEEQNYTIIPSFVLSGISIAMCIFLYISLTMFGVSWTYYTYFITPILIWYLVFKELPFIFNIMKKLQQQKISHSLLPIIVVLSIAVGTFYKRSMIMFSIVGACIWVLATTKSKNRLVKVTWITLCLCLLPFPTLTEIVKADERKGIMFLGGIFATIMCFCIQVSNIKRHPTSTKSKSILLISYSTSLLPFITGCFGYMASTNSAVFARGILVFSWIAPFFTSAENIYERLQTLQMWQLSSYIILSQSYDALFYVVLTASLHIWVILQDDVSTKEIISENIKREDGSIDFESDRPTIIKSRPNATQASQIQQTCVLFSFLLVGFFGLYSVESFNHFRVRSLPFMPPTSHFTLLVLNFYKIILHYMAIGISICAVASLRKTSSRIYWYITVILSDMLTIHFLFRVRDTGSWADIGFSIANLGIVIGLPFGLLILVLLGNILLHVRLPKQLRCS